MAPRDKARESIALLPGSQNRTERFLIPTDNAQALSPTLISFVLQGRGRSWLSPASDSEALELKICS